MEKALILISFCLVWGCASDGLNPNVTECVDLNTIEKPLEVEIDEFSQAELKENCLRKGKVFIESRSNSHISLFWFNNCAHDLIAESQIDATKPTNLLVDLQSVTYGDISATCVCPMRVSFYSTESEDCSLLESARVNHDGETSDWLLSEDCLFKQQD